MWLLLQALCDAAFASVSRAHGPDAQLRLAELSCSAAHSAISTESKTPKTPSSSMRRGSAAHSDSLLAASAGRGLELSCHPGPQWQGACAASGAAASAGSDWGSGGAATLQWEKQRRLAALGLVSPRSDKAAGCGSDEATDTQAGDEGTPYHLVPLLPQDTPRKPLQRRIDHVPKPDASADASEVGKDVLGVLMEGRPEQDAAPVELGMQQVDAMQVSTQERDLLSASLNSDASVSPSGFLCGGLHVMHL
jgi:hypothetical protein